MTREQLWDHIAAFLKLETEKMWAWQHDQQYRREYRRALYHEVTELLRRYCEDNRIPLLRNPFIVVCDSTNNMPRAEEVTVVTDAKRQRPLASQFLHTSGEGPKPAS